MHMKHQQQYILDISKLDKYPILSNLDINDQKAGARVDIDPEKRNPYDFALWIKAPENHLMKWDSLGDQVTQVGI